ncbi:MAG: hypothetical protein LDL33_11980 [Desulfomonile sp.]|nr:hypothetical protein [Desulfomonile sp.]
MKAILVAASAIVLLCAASAVASDGDIYDRSYSGPRNYYGQPTFEPYHLQGQQAQQGQPVDNGLIFQAARGIYQIGNFLWGFTPAPLRGVQSPYSMSPDSGQVTVNFVPGTR